MHSFLGSLERGEVELSNNTRTLPLQYFARPTIIAQYSIFRFWRCIRDSIRDCATVAISYDILNDAQDSMMFSEHNDT